MTKTPDQDTQTVATSPAGPIPWQAPIPTHTAGHTVNTGEKDTLDQQTGDEDVGNINQDPESDDPLAEAPARPREEPLKVTVKRRLEAEGRWAGRIELERNDMMKAARKQGMSKLSAQLIVYSELDRLYPPLAKPDSIGVSGNTCTDDQRTMAGSGEFRTSLSDRTLSGSQRPVVHGRSEDNVRVDAPSTGDKKRTMSGAQRPVDDGQIQGLSAVPEEWPELPANASLSTEIGWVQANRLRIVEEGTACATVVHLGRALSPAPSWAALGWLETSIRSYAKYVDVAAKATSSDDGEADVVRRERMAIEEVSTLLDEMREADG